MSNPIPGLLPFDLPAREPSRLAGPAIGAEGRRNALRTLGQVGSNLDMSRSHELEADWNRLLDEHGAALRRVASTYEADRSRQDDLFQEICLAIWRALPRFRRESSERTFVFRIAHNRGSTHGFRQRRRADHEADLPEEGSAGHPREDPSRNPEAAAVALDRQRRLQGALRSLPTVARQVLALTLEGVSQREIGEILGLSEGNVAVRLHRARKALSQRLAATEAAVAETGPARKGGAP